MTEVGLGAFRQNASELVRRAQAGERVTITISGRPAAQLGPVGSRSWLSWACVDDLFAVPGDRNWETDQGRLGDGPRDPWDC